MPRPSPYQISAFTHAVREGSFSRAAMHLGVTQSSITQHVANLEAQMGTLLLIRRRDGLELTRAGRELFELSDRMVTIEKLIEEKVEDYSSLDEGYLRIVATAPRPAMPIIARFSRAFPGVKLEFSLFSWTLCTQMLRERSVDIAIYTAPDRNSSVHVREIARTRYLAFMRRDHALAEKSQISLADLQSEYVLLPEDGSLTQRLIAQKAEEHSIAFKRIIKTTSFPVLKEAILHGAGVGFLLEGTLYPASDLIGIPIVEMPETYADCVVTQTEKRDLRAVQKFLTIVAEHGAGN